MATIPCTACGEPVSPIADKCLHCEPSMLAGRLKGIFSYRTLFLVIVLIVLTQRDMGQ
ncbi:MAG: hypothetical protein V3U93_05895 [Alphaproteobacteria bacterium]